MSNPPFSPSIADYRTVTDSLRQQVSDSVIEATERAWINEFLDYAADAPTVEWFNGGEYPDDRIKLIANMGNYVRQEGGRWDEYDVFAAQDAMYEIRDSKDLHVSLHESPSKLRLFGHDLKLTTVPHLPDGFVVLYPKFYGALTNPVRTGRPAAIATNVQSGTTITFTIRGPETLEIDTEEP